MEIADLLIAILFGVLAYWLFGEVGVPGVVSLILAIIIGYIVFKSGLGSRWF